MPDFGKYIDVKTVVSLAAAGLILGALVTYGRQIPIIGDQVAELARAAK